jgi:hypothetical protein
MLLAQGLGDSNPSWHSDAVGGSHPPHLLTSYSLETYSFGTDEDGDEITTSIVSDDIPEREAKAPQKRALTDRQKIAIDALTEALISFGRSAPAVLRLTQNIQVVDAGKWRDELFTRGILDRDAPNPRKEFFRIRDALIARASLASGMNSSGRCSHDRPGVCSP